MASEARHGGTAFAVSTHGMQSLDPTEANFVHTTGLLSGLMVRSLNQHLTNPTTGNVELVPDLATTTGQSNDDYTAWHFQIRDGLKWETGDDLTAQDVAFGIGRTFENCTAGAFPMGAHYTHDYFLDGDQFFGPYTSAGQECRAVSVHGNTVTLLMRRPFPGLPHWAALPAMSPIPRGAASDPEIYRHHPWATGPYMLDAGSDATKDVFRLVRNPHWEAGGDPGRKAYPDTWEVDTTPGDPAGLDRRLLDDGPPYDQAVTWDDVRLANLEEAEASGRLVRAPAPSSIMYCIDVRKPEFSDMRVRLALNHAFPYEDFWIGGGAVPDVTRVPGTMILPPGVPGRKEPAFDVVGHGGRRTNTVAARRLLEDADAVGAPVRFALADTSPKSQRLASVLISALRDAGFDPMAIECGDASGVFQEQQNPDSDLNFRFLGWTSDWPNGSAWISPLFRVGGVANFSFLADDEIEARAQALESSSPSDLDQKEWGELDELIMRKHLPIVHIGYSQRVVLHGSRLNGVRIDPVRGIPDLRAIWVDSV